MSSLADLISGAITDRGTDMVEQAVFGTADSEVIASGFEEAVRGILMLQIDEVMFYETSVGCVVGLRLEHGSQVVMKAHQRRWSDGFLRATQHVQGFIAAAGFPCPRPLAGPTNVLGGLAVIESYLSDPGRRPTTEPMLAISAAGLARQINLCRGLAVAGLGPHPMDAEQDLYPLPHSPIFDFEATAAGAEWIDRLARAARTVRDEHVCMPVIAHCDWSARNVRFDGTRLLAVYDWDSVANVSEAVAVGQAAATWSAFDGSDAAPTANEIATYVRHYEQERGSQFEAVERVVIGAAALYVLAYTARCEHAIDPDELVHRRARPRLASDGDVLLSLSDLMA